ncbi:MAG: anti-sigma factor [Chloroflexota bacterium]|nr:anti-sigma factor [Chloroflexota bacterium]
MSHERFSQNIGAYALGALDPQEESELQEHVRECEDCAAELSAYSQLRHGLNAAVPQAALPDGFSERLMQRAAPHQREPRPLVTVAPTPSKRASRLPWMLVAASLILALGLGGRAWQLERELDQRRATLASMVELLGGEDVVVRDAGASGNGTHTRVYLSPEGDIGMVVFDDMPPPPPGRVYQLWIGNDSEVESVATFAPNANGNWFRLLKPPGGLEAYDSVGVSVEREGGSPQPTGEWDIWAEL